MQSIAEIMAEAAYENNGKPYISPISVLNNVVAYLLHSYSSATPDWCPEISKADIVVRLVRGR